MTRFARACLPIIAAVALAGGLARADSPANAVGVKEEGGKWFDKAGNPTYHIEGNKVDYYTFAGYIRYTANCMQCHGPDGLGSSFGPSLVDALKTLDYTQFLTTVVNGKKTVNAASNLVMPAWGDNRNVMCYVDDIYIYLRARANGALGRGRPTDHPPKPEAFKTAEDQCMG